MDRIKLAGVCVLASTLVLSGCVARTYNLTRDRVDQDLSPTSGNRGYLRGNAPEPQNREATRTVRVFEIELGKRKQVDSNYSAITPLVINTEEPAMLQEEVTKTESVSGDFQKYKVGKNDTLQKISQKFYGTTKRWLKIYEANQDSLSSPNKLYPGQTLRISSAGMIKAGSPGAAETTENLK